MSDVIKDTIIDAKKNTKKKVIKAIEEMIETWESLR